MKRKVQFGIILLGFIALIYGILIMSETKTMILPLWFVITPVVIIVCAISYGLGVVTKYLLRSDLYRMTFASIIIIIFVGVYGVVEYKPTLKIIIAENYTGEVKLFVSNDSIEECEIPVSNFGVGYITNKDFEKGFYPKILRGAIEITKNINEYSKGVFTTTTAVSYSVKYLSFVIPGSSKELDNDIDYLIKTGALDTLRLPGK